MRTELEKRPLLIACLGLLIGLASGVSWTNLLFLPIALFVVRPWGARTVIAGFCAMGLLLSGVTRVDPLSEKMFVAGPATVVSEPRIYREGQSCDVRTSLGEFRFDWNGDPQLSLGDEIWVEGEARPPLGMSGPHLLAKGLRGTLFAKEGDVRVVRDARGLSEVGARWRRAFLEHTAASLSPVAAETTDALCFNVDGKVGAELRENLQRTGTTHIVSASGLHVFILAFAVQWVLSLLPIPRWAQLMLLAVVLACYAAGAGMRPPIVRSVLMAGFVGCAYLCRRESDFLSALAAVALAYLIWKPESVSDIGFQLSFVTVAAFGLYPPFLSAFRTSPAARLVDAARAAMRTSWYATVAASPIVAYHFGIVSVISVVANVLIVVALPGVIVGAMLSLALADLVPAASFGIARFVVEPLAGWVLCVVDSFGSLAFAAFRVPEFSPYWLVPYYAGFLLLWRKRARPA